MSCSTTVGGSGSGPADASDILDLLEDALHVIEDLHAALPDDGKENGGAPSWWGLGQIANVVGARLVLELRRNGRDLL